MLFNSCIFLNRLARHGNTHVEPKKYIETLANLVSINQSSTSLGQRKTSLTMAFDYRSVSFWIFLCDRIDSIIQFDVFWWFLGNEYGLPALARIAQIHFLKKTLIHFWSSIFETIFFREHFLLFLWWHYRSSCSRPKVVNCTLMHLFV